jgi:hypothetical protein
MNQQVFLARRRFTLLNFAFLAFYGVSPGLLHAQITRCVDQAGNVQFSNMGCPASTKGSTVNVRPNSIDTSGMRQQNRIELTALPRRNQDEAQMVMQQSAGQASECPSELEIRNMGVSGNSVTTEKKERDFHKAEVRRAEGCRRGEGNYIESDWKVSKEARNAQSSINHDTRQDARLRAEGMHSVANPAEGARIQQERNREAAIEAARRRAAARTIGSCQSNGCTAFDGTFYSTNDSITFFGPTGICQRLGNQLNCPTGE